MDGMRFAAVVVLAYVLGSIPGGYVWAKLLKNVDVTKVGSGRTGSSNVLRAAGIGPAVLTFLSDLGKGYGAVALARWLAAASVYIGNDSGISHLAAACGAPVIALFGPTNPRVWAPRGRVCVLPFETPPADVARAALGFARQGRWTPGGR